MSNDLEVMDDLERRIRAARPASGRRETPLTDRASRELAELLATDTARSHAGSTHRAAPPRRHRMIFAAAAASALMLAVSASGLLGGERAYATWNPVPTTPVLDVQQTLAQECRDYLTKDFPGEREARGKDLLKASELVLAEVRGDWSFVVLTAGPRLPNATCLLDRNGNGYGGYGLDPDLDFPGTTPSTLTSGQVAYLGMSTTDGKDGYWSLTGATGMDVAGVTVIAESGQEINATVLNGRFAAWWPAYVVTAPPTDPFMTKVVVTRADGSTVGPTPLEEIFEATR